MLHCSRGVRVYGVYGVCVSVSAVLLCHFDSLQSGAQIPAEVLLKMPLSGATNKRCLWGEQVKRANWVSFKNLLVSWMESQSLASAPTKRQKQGRAKNVNCLSAKWTWRAKARPEPVQPDGLWSSPFGVLKTFGQEVRFIGLIWADFGSASVAAALYRLISPKTPLSRPIPTGMGCLRFCGIFNVVSVLFALIFSVSSS